MKVLLFVGFVVFISSFSWLTEKWGLWAKCESKAICTIVRNVFQVAKAASCSGARVCGWEDSDCYPAGPRNIGATTQYSCCTGFEKVSYAFLFFSSSFSFLSRDVSAMFLPKSANQASTCWCEFSLNSAHFWSSLFLLLGVQSTLGPQNNDRNVWFPLTDSIGVQFYCGL